MGNSFGLESFTKSDNYVMFATHCALCPENANHAPVCDTHVTVKLPFTQSTLHTCAERNATLFLLG